MTAKIWTYKSPAYRRGYSDGTNPAKPFAPGPSYNTTQRRDYNTGFDHAIDDRDLPFAKQA